MSTYSPRTAAWGSSEEQLPNDSVKQQLERFTVRVKRYGRMIHCQRELFETWANKRLICVSWKAHVIHYERELFECERMGFRCSVNYLNESRKCKLFKRFSVWVRRSNESDWITNRFCWRLTSSCYIKQTGNVWLNYDSPFFFTKILT